MALLVKIITFPLSILYWFVFFLILIVFHGVQWVTYNLFGYQAHKKSVDIMNFFIVKSLYITGVFYRVKGAIPKPQDGPTIIISNHQSMFDIPPMIWYLRALHPKFIAKKELSKGVPGISFNLRHGGSVLIDRGNREEAMKAIISIGQYISDHSRSVVIFPEGTRSVTGVPKKWKQGGLQTLLKTLPDANILPITINGSWKVLKNKGWPVPFGNKIEMIVHKIERLGDKNPEEFIEQIKQIVEGPLQLTKV